MAAFRLGQCLWTVVDGPPEVRGGSPGGPQAVSEEKSLKNLCQILNDC
jgi:hypothetical protein